MYEEHTAIALTIDIPLERISDVPPGSPLLDGDNPHEGLIAGDIGIIVHIYPGGDAFIVEFLEEDGYTAALADVSASQVRPATSEDLANDRFRTKSPV